MSKYYNPTNESVGVLGDGLRGLGGGSFTATGVEKRSAFDQNFLKKYNDMALTASYTEKYHNQQMMMQKPMMPYNEKYHNQQMMMPPLAPRPPQAMMPYNENFVIPDYRTSFDKKYLTKYDTLAMNRKY